MRNSLLLLLVPSLALAEKIDLAHAPAMPSAPAWTAPAPEVVVAPGGARVAVLAQSALPLVHVAVAVQAGSELDAADKPGLAALTARALRECGAGARSGTEVAQAFDELGAELDSEIDESGVRFTLTVVSTRLPKALALLGDVLARPRFDAAAFDGARARQIAEVLRRQDRPREIAEEAFMETIYGTHPYGHSPEGTPTALAKISVDEVRAFWANRYGPRVTTVILVGDARADRAASQVGQALAGWSGKALPPPAPPAPAKIEAREVKVTRAGAPQSEVRIGTLGASWSSPDVAALTLLETVLGGSFTSRLNQNLREKHGWTYGVRAEFRLLRAPGPFAAWAAIRADATADAIREFRAELAAVRAPIPPAELAKAKALVRHRIVEIFGEGNASAATLAELAINDQPLDYYTRFPTLLDAVQPDALAQVAARAIPSDLTLVVVGDPKSPAPKPPARKPPAAKPPAPQSPAQM
jgi:predicted Zn-dependent peptidase